MPELFVLMAAAVLWFCWPVPYKIYRWIRNTPTEPAVGQKWVFADLSPRWPPHNFEITEITETDVLFISNWIEYAPDHGIKPRDQWSQWAKETRAFPL